MSWQDLVIFVASLVFTVALVPLVRQAVKANIAPPVGTSLPTSLGLYAICVCYATLGLPVSFAITAISGTLWGFLAVRAMQLQRKSGTLQR